MLQKPLVTIIIPSFNRDSIILETLTSVKKQYYENFECIVVDDHSTDNTFNEVLTFTETDKRFKVVKRKKNKKGASVCRNEGINLSNGSFIMFLDSDDLLAPYCLHDRVNISNKNANADFFVFQVGIFHDSSYICDILWSKITSENSLNSFLWSKGWSISNSFFRSEFLKRDHFFNEEAQSWQDVEFHIRALLKKPVIVFSEDNKPDVFIRFSNISRVSNTNLSFQRIKSRLNTYLSIEEKLINAGQFDFVIPFKLYFFKYLEISARTHKYEHFKELYTVWKLSETFKIHKYDYIKQYLLFQSFLTKNRLYYIGSVFYKLIRFFLPLKILSVKNRVENLRNPINVRELVFES